MRTALACVVILAAVLLPAARVRSVSPPISLAFSWSSSVGPHDPAVRFEYTVPTGRRAVVETVYLAIELDTDATCCANSSSETLLSIAPAQTGQFSSMYAAHIWSSLSAGAKEVIALAPHKTLQAGDTIKAVTVNLKSGGSAIHTVFVTLTEEDAP